jgi:hypothetical protein
MKVIYKKNGYDARVYRSNVVVVYRDGATATGATHVGEKHPSQDWREVCLAGCPDNVRQEIIEAWKLEFKL